MQSKRTQAERSAATRSALVAAARPLFAERGFGEVGTPEIAAAAGVTRGALYHQFADKAELFAAVVEEVEEELVQGIGAVAAARGAEDPLAGLHAGAEAWLDACADPVVQRILLLDAPAVLGWERWREIGLRYGLGLVEGTLAAAVAAGQLPAGPTRPLAHLLVGALDEAALYVARAEDPVAARREMSTVVQGLLTGLSGAAGEGAARRGAPPR